MTTKDKATPEVEATNGIAKIVTVYVVKSELTSVNFPTKARAKAAQELLTLFKVAATIETVKKTIHI